MKLSQGFHQRHGSSTLHECMRPDHHRDPDSVVQWVDKGLVMRDVHKRCLKPRDSCQETCGFDLRHMFMVSKTFVFVDSALQYY